MAAPYKLKWVQIFGNYVRTFFSKQLIKCPSIPSTSKRAFIGDSPSKISAAKAITNAPQLYKPVCFWTDKKLMMNFFT